MTGIQAFNPTAAMNCYPGRYPDDNCGGPRIGPVINDRDTRRDDDCYIPRRDRCHNPFRFQPNRDFLRCWPGAWQGGGQFGWPSPWQGGGNCGGPGGWPVRCPGEWQGRPVYPSIDNRHNEPCGTGPRSLTDIISNWGYDTMAERAEMLRLQDQGMYRNLVMHSTPNSYYLT